MRKIRECINDSMIKTDLGLPICLSLFIQHMAVILLSDSSARLLMDAPAYEIAGEKFDGKAKLKPELLDHIKVLNGEDLFRNQGQFFQLHGFIGWFLEQDEPADDSELMWFDEDFLGKKWNEYAAEQRGKKGYERRRHSEVS